jgi:hypothetical protein
MAAVRQSSEHGETPCALAVILPLQKGIASNVGVCSTTPLVSNRTMRQECHSRKNTASSASKRNAPYQPAIPGCDNRYHSPYLYGLGAIDPY